MIGGTVIFRCQFYPGAVSTPALLTMQTGVANYKWPTAKCL